MNFDNQNKKSINILFDKIAPIYDVLNDVMSFGLQKKIKKMAVKNVLKYQRLPENILDLCTGTGDIALLLKSFFPNSKVVGVDFSEKMLEIARNRAESIIFLKEDVTKLSNILSCDEEKFDICFISFGLRNLPSIDDFLVDIKKILNENAVLAILDVGKPYAFIKWYFYFHFNVFIPLVAKIFNKDISPYKYFIQSIKKYPSQIEIAQKLQENGYSILDVKNYMFGIFSQHIVLYKA